MEREGLEERRSLDHLVPAGKNPVPPRGTQPLFNDKEDAPLGDGTRRAKPIQSSLEEFVVDCILGHIIGDHKSREYKIRWVGYGPEEDT